jgi:hypothetical protein
MKYAFTTATITVDDVIIPGHCDIPGPQREAHAIRAADFCRILLRFMCDRWDDAMDASRASAKSVCRVIRIAQCAVGV